MGVVRKGGRSLSSLYPPSEQRNLKFEIMAFIFSSSSPYEVGQDLKKQIQNQVQSDYWSELFSGTEYEVLYNSILEKYGNEPPSGFWDVLTGRDRTNKYQHDMSRDDELSALAEKMYNEEYNSYENQSKLMKEAGLNPDLLGVNGGASSEMSPNGVNPNIMADNPIASMSSIAMTAVGLANSVVSSLGTGLQLDNMRLENLNKMDSFVLSYILDNVDPRSVLDGSLADDKRADIIASASDFASNVYGMNRRQARLFASSVSRQIDSPKFFEQYYGFMSRGSSNRSDYIGNTSGKYYDEQDSTMRALFGVILDAQQDAMKHQAEYQSDYYSSRDGSTQASSENVLDVLSGDTASQDLVDNYQRRNSNYVIKRINKVLGKMSDDGNTFAAVVLSFLNQMLNSKIPLNFGPSGIKGAMEFVGGLK